MDFRRTATCLRQRLLKEAVHEIGHTLDLTHCDDYHCAMAPSHAVEWIDLKDAHFVRFMPEPRAGSLNPFTKPFSLMLPSGA